MAAPASAERAVITDVSMRKPLAGRHGQARTRVVKNFKRAKDLDNGQKWIFRPAMLGLFGMVYPAYHQRTLLHRGQDSTSQQRLQRGCNH